MKFRKQFFPKYPVDIIFFLMVSSLIPVVYWFEVFVVLNALYEPWTFGYIFHLVFAHFLLSNVTGSLLGSMLIDTSVTNNFKLFEGENAQFCMDCNLKLPPRAWHCTTCNTCVLKRDHHCMITGCCIGHYNQRYFLMFIFYMLVSTIYCLYYNYVFLTLTMTPKQLFLKVVFCIPMALTRMSADNSFVYIEICYAIIAGFFLSAGMLWYHGRILIKGSVSYENKHNITKYNTGIKNNFMNVFGERWYISWISPFIVSKLPSDGFQWSTNDHFTDRKR